MMYLKVLQEIKLLMILPNLKRLLNELKNQNRRVQNYGKKELKKLKMKKLKNWKLDKKIYSKEKIKEIL